MISVARWCRHLATTVFSILSSAHRVVPRYRFDRLAIHDLNSTFATSSCNEKLQSKKARDNSLQRIVATCKNESTTCCSFVQFSRLSIPPGEGGGGLGGVGGVGVGGRPRRPRHVAHFRRQTTAQPLEQRHLVGQSGQVRRRDAARARTRKGRRPLRPIS